MTKTRDTITNVINSYGSSVTITPLTLSFSKYGDKTESTGTPVSTVGVTYDIFSTRMNIQPMGKVPEGDLMVIIKYNETVTAPSGATEYKVTYNGVEYSVSSVEDYVVANTTLAKNLILKKRL